MGGKTILAIGLGVVSALLLAFLIYVWTYDADRLKPHIQKWVLNATGRELSIKGPMRLRPGWNPRLVVREVTFQNAAWGTRPEMATIEEVDVGVALFPLIAGRLEIKHLTVVRPDILIETDKEGRSNLDLTPPPGHPGKDGGPKGLPLLPDFRDVRVMNGILSLRDGRTGATYPLRMDGLTLASEAFGEPCRIRMKGAYREAAFEIAGTIGSFRGLVDPSVTWPLKLEGRGLGIEGHVEGEIRDPVRLKGVNLAISLEGPVAAIRKGGKRGVPEPGGRYRVSCRMTDGGPRGWRFSEVEVTGEGNQVSGEVNVNLGPQRPHIQADLVSPRLDIRPFMALLGGEKGTPVAKTSKEGGRVFPEAPLGLRRLNAVDLAVAFQMDSLLLPHLTLHGVKGSVIVDDGRFHLKPFTARAGEGDVTADVEIDVTGRTPSLAARIKGVRLNLGGMLKEAGVKRPIEGMLDTDLNLRGRGDSVAAMMAGMNGAAVLDMRHARIVGTHMGRLPGDLGTGLLLLLNPLKKADEMIAVNCMVSEFHIKDGTARSNVFFLDTPALTAAGVGWVDLKTEELRFGIKPKSKQGIGLGETGRLGVGLSELARPFELTGTLAHPTLTVSTTDAVLTIAKAVGGVALLGPVGPASLFVSGDFGEMDSCEQARNAIGQPPKEKRERTGDKKGSSLQEGMDNIKGAIKGLFGN